MVRKAVAILALALAAACQAPEVAAPGLPHALVVLVRSAGDVPVAGARVELFRGPENEEYADMDALRFRPSAEPPPVLAVTADGKGTAALHVPAPGRYWISAVAKGFGRETVGATIEEGVAAPEVVVPLVAGHTLDGTITGENGPLAGIEVIAAPTSQCRIWPCDEACDRTTTDVSGVFRFDTLEPGEYGVWYRPDGGVLVRAGIVRIPLVTHLPVKAHKGGIVAGIVRDAETGTPLEGAVVRAVGDDDRLRVEARTDAAGRFEARTNEVTSFLLNLRVERPGYVPAYEGPAGIPATGFTDGQRLDLDLALEPATVLQGRVLGPAGPLPGIRVHCQRYNTEGYAVIDDISSPETTSRADGSYRLDLDQGPYGLMVQPSGTRTTWEWSDAGKVDVPARGSVTHDIHVDLAHADISGSVVDDAGNAVTGARVSCGDGPLGAATRTDARGRFLLKATLFPGEAELAAEAPGFVPDWASYERAPANLRLVRLAPVATRVCTPDGTPVAGARIASCDGAVGICVFLYRFGGLCQGVTSADGRCEVRAPVDDGFLLCEWSPSDGSATEAWIDPERVPPPLGQWIRTISGRAVLKGSGRAIAGLFACVVSAGDTVIHDVTAADGRFRVRLPPGGKIQIAGDGYVPANVAPGVENEVLVEMQPDLRVTGVVRLEGGGPLAGAEVDVDGADDESVGSCTTDTEGRFVVRGVPEGEYTLVVGTVGQDVEGQSMPVRAGARDVQVVLKRVTAAAAPD